MSQSQVATLELPRPARSTKTLPVPLLTVAAILALAHLPLLIAHLRVLWLKPHYELFPLVFLGAGVLALPAWRLAQSGSTPSPAAKKWGLILLGLNWLLLTTAVAIESPWMAMVSFWELLAAVALFAGGTPVLIAALPALAYLLIIIPPPFNLDGKLVSFLQTWTSRISGRLLDYLSVLHFSDGNTVEIGSKRYFVDKACSGINSLFSTLAVTWFYLLWTRAHWLRSVLLLLVAVFWVVIANVIRVSLIVWMDSKFGVDLSKDGWDPANGMYYQHTILGFALFGLVLALVASSDRFLRFLGTAVRWGDEPSGAAEAAPAPVGDAFVTRLGWSAFAPALAAYGLLALIQLGELHFRVAITEPAYVQRFNTWTVDVMPERIPGGWKRQDETTFESRDRDNPFGAHSRTWRYQAENGLMAIVSFDYPFPEWHDLRLCYKGIGWREEKSEPFTHKVKDGTLDCMKFELVKSFERRGYGWFTEFDPAGRPVPKGEVTILPNTGTINPVERFRDMRDRWASLFGGVAMPMEFGDVLQVQVLVEHDGPLPAAEKDQVEKFFLQSADLIRGMCAAGAAGK
jgi:exosortase